MPSGTPGVAGDIAHDLATRPLKNPCAWQSFAAELAQPPATSCYLKQAEDDDAGLPAVALLGYQSAAFVTPSRMA